MGLVTPINAHCLACGLDGPLSMFPTGRPRLDGSRHPMSYCRDCLSLAHRPGGRVLAQRRADRTAARRRRERGPICGVCLSVRTQRSVCHGCARRVDGPMTATRLAALARAAA